MLGIYIRKSRDRKKEKSLREQKLLGQEFAMENNMEFQFYDEGIISGQKDRKQRPKFSQLLDDIEQGKISGVYIWDSSRLARNEIAWHTFADLLRDTGTILYDNGVNADFRDENTYLFYTIKAGMDAHFARITAKKIKTVLKRNAMDGLPHGIVPYGYTTDEQGKWKIHDEEIETVKIIFELYQKGYGYIRIANHLNELGIQTRYNTDWAPTTIRYIIYNTTYSGRAKHNNIEIQVPAIIDKTLHDKLLKDIANRYKKPGAKSKKFILNEILVCAKCGTRYTIAQRNRHSYYRCLSEINRGVPKCFSKAVKAEHIDKLIIEYILFGNELYEHTHRTYLEGGNIELKTQLRKKLSYHKRKAEELTEELKRNHLLFNKGGIELDWYMTEKKRIDNLMFKADKQVQTLKDELIKIENTDRVLEELSIDFDYNLPNIWKDEKNPAIRAMMQHAIKGALLENRKHRNKKQINSTITFDEKVAMVDKYIKHIKIDYQQVPLIINIEFNLPVPPMKLMMESRYYGALNLDTNKIYFIKDFGKDPKRIYNRMKAEFDKHLSD